jgi:hypothetical protein
LPSPDFESGASTDSATPAVRKEDINHTIKHTYDCVVDTEKRAGQ